MDEQRAEFEAWAMQQGMPLDMDERHGDYKRSHTLDAWITWQAATKRQQERIAELQAQVQALSLDAGRYRWLREQPYSEWKRIGWGNWVEQIARDTEIDAAIAAGKGEG